MNISFVKRGVTETIKSSIQVSETSALLATFVVCETFAIYLVRSFCCAFLTAANKYSLGKEEGLYVDAKKANEKLSPKGRRKNS